VRTIRHVKVFERLDPRHHGALRAKLLGDDRLTDVYHWLIAVGCKTPPGSLCRYRKQLAAEDRRRREERDAVEEKAMDRVFEVLIVRDMLRESPGKLAPVHDRRRYAETVLAYAELLIFESLACLPEPKRNIEWLRQFNRYGDALSAVVDARVRFEKRRIAAERAAAKERATGGGRAPDHTAPPPGMN
jgi:hypothetical protein